ncbi:MAG: cytochrome c [Bacillota bacterium]|nr:cytochrome c [Bacillota bacterium]
MQKSCVSYHGQNLEGVVGPSLNDIQSKLSQSDIENIIVNGRGNMPAGLVSKKEAQTIAEWLSSRTGSETSTNSDTNTTSDQSSEAPQQTDEDIFQTYMKENGTTLKAKDVQYDDVYEDGQGNVALAKQANF